MTTLPKWQRRLAIPDAVLKPISGEGEAYGVFPRGDQRRRPLARVERQTVLQARAEGVIVEAAPDCFRLVESPDVLSQRRDGNFQAFHSVPLKKVFIDEAGRIEQREVNLADSPLARWMKPDPGTGTCWLTQEEFEAGERLRADYHRSVLTDRITSDWEGYLAPVKTGRPRAREEAPATAQDAKDRVLTALAAAGPGLDRILSRVCLRETGLEAAEQAENWPRRSGKAILKLALQRLAIHYGMIRKADISL